MDETVLGKDSTAFLVKVLEDFGDRWGPEFEARLLELLGDRRYRDAARRQRRNDLIRALDRECRGDLISIRQRAHLVGRELSVGAVPAIADRAGDRRRQLARDILVLSGGRVPGFRSLQMIIVGSNAEDPEPDELAAQEPPL
jgi:nitroreductase